TTSTSRSAFMPLYPFKCGQCGMEFEVSRKMSESSKPANCPVDGTEGTRIFTAPVRLTTRGQDAPPAPPSSAPQEQGFSHFAHSPGAGSHAHSHSHGGPGEGQ